MKLNIKKRFLNRKLHGQIESFFLFELPRFSRKLFAPFESRAWQNKNEEGRKITRGLSHIKHTIFISSHTHTLFTSLPYTHTHTHTLTLFISLPYTYTHTHTHFLSCFCFLMPSTFSKALTYIVCLASHFGPMHCKTCQFWKTLFF
jgi:hypothetical protein